MGEGEKEKKGKTLEHEKKNWEGGGKKNDGTFTFHTASHSLFHAR